MSEHEPGSATLLRQLRALLVLRLVAVIRAEWAREREAGRRTDFGYDDCPVCLAARAAVGEHGSG